MSAADRERSRVTSGADGPIGGASRPYLVALIESQPLPTLAYTDHGEAVLANSEAAYLLTTGPAGTKRVLAQDGTDVWTVIAARSAEANPLFDIRLRLRVAGESALDVTMAVTPIRGAAGELAGAFVFVLSAPTARLRSREPGTSRSHTRDFDRVIADLGHLAGAAAVAVFEVDPDFSGDARALATWTSTDLPSMPGVVSLHGTVADSFAGRRVVCMPSGLCEAYPADPMVVAGGFEAYVGVALANDAGEQTGILGGVWREPLSDVPGTCAAFTIAARRVSHILSDVIAERELRESEQRYGSVFEGSSVPMLLIEPETTQIMDANPAACALYGYPRDDFVTMSVLQVDTLDSETVQAELHRALDGSRSAFIGRHLLADGSTRDVEVSIGPIMVGGRPLLYSMIHDITERKRMEGELERGKRNLELIVEQRTEDLLRANAELQQASTARDMVFVNLAQELRTSLQTITGFSELLLGGMAGELTHEQRRQIEMMQQAGKRLTTFATTLIETRKLEDDLVCEPESFDLVGLVESVLFGLASFAEDKGLSLALVAEERPLDSETDRYKLQQILLNLLSNAIRYTAKGGVTVTVARDGENGCTVAVADTGPGLEAERLETLFDGPEVHDSAAGIGLPASKRIATLLGGTIDVRSELNQGSVFTVRIPTMCTPDTGTGE